MFIKELRGVPSVFTLQDGSTLRVLPNQTVEIDSCNVSSDIVTAVSMKLVSVYEEAPNVSHSVENHTTDHEAPRTSIPKLKHVAKNSKEG